MYMLIAFFYEVILLFFGLLWLPHVFYSMCVQGKYKSSFLKRFGANFPHFERGKGLVIWVHAVSVGEVKAVLPLLELMYSQIPNLQIVLSTITETGQAEAMRPLKFPCTPVFLPFDFGFIIKPIMRQVQPDVVIVSETDFWFRFLSIAKSYGAKTVLVNGKVSAKSTNRFQLFPFVSKWLFSCIDLFCVQNEEYATHFSLLGVPKEKIVITGNLKFDQESVSLTEEEKKELRYQCGIIESDIVIVIGSTHPTEESIILRALKSLWGKHQNLKVLIVPRHPERFDEVAALLKEEGISYYRYTSKDPQNARVVLVDAMGILTKCYQIADIAVVGGSFVPDIGGHNILEPVEHGIAVVFGPHMHNQLEMVKLVLDAECGFQIQEFLLHRFLEALLDDKEELQKISKAGSALTEKLGGAAERTLLTIRKFHIA